MNMKNHNENRSYRNKVTHSLNSLLELDHFGNLRDPFDCCIPFYFRVASNYQR